MMKMITTTLALFVVGSATSLESVAAQKGNTRTITVFGTADVFVVPDEVVVSITVETLDKDVTVARSQTADKCKQVFQIASTHGLEERHINTDYVRIAPENAYYKPYPFLGYKVRQDITLTLKQIEQYEPLLTALLQAGVTGVGSIEFRTSELRKHRDEARTKAIKAAKEKATVMAGAFGEQVGRPRRIEEQPEMTNSWRGSFVTNFSQEVGSGSGTSEIAPGQIRISATITATFDLVE